MPRRFGPIFGTGIGILDILMNRNRGSAGNDSRFSINKFKAKLNDSNINGLWQPNRYVVEIHPGAKTPAYVRNQVENLKFLCNSASLPGVQIITSDHRRQNMGTFDRRPFGVQVTDIPLTFFLDQRGMVLSMFRAWTNAIVNYQYQDTGEHKADVAGKQLFEVGYRDEYLCEIDIYCLDQKQENVVQYHLYEAFPMQVGDVTTAWSETDSFGLVPVQFTFRTYDIRQFGVETQAVSQAESATTLDVPSGATFGTSKQPIIEATGIGGRPITLPT
jgi:hypothetical protein